MKQKVRIVYASAPYAPSPVYWAGASLKPRTLYITGYRKGQPSPVYWAGASLKHYVFR